MNRAAATELLYLALGEPLGVLLRTSDYEKARMALYAARTAAMDPALDCLQFRRSPFPDGDLVIAKGLPPAQRGRPPRTQSPTDAAQTIADLDI